MVSMQTVPTQVWLLRQPLVHAARQVLSTGLHTSGEAQAPPTTPQAADSTGVRHTGTPSAITQ
jgi:hypothetical protein